MLIHQPPSHHRFKEQQDKRSPGKEERVDQVKGMLVGSRDSIFPHPQFRHSARQNLRKLHFVSRPKAILSLSQPSIPPQPPTRKRAPSSQVIHSISNLHPISIHPSAPEHFLFRELRRRRFPRFQRSEKSPQKKVSNANTGGYLRQKALMPSVPNSKSMPCYGK